MTIDDIAVETDTEKKATLMTAVKDYENIVKTQTALKAQYEKEVTRLKEANDNT
jgi:hypothetical protein